MVGQLTISDKYKSAILGKSQFCLADNCTFNNVYEVQNLILELTIEGTSMASLPQLIHHVDGCRLQSENKL